MTEKKAYPCSRNSTRHQGNTVCGRQGLNRRDFLKAVGVVAAGTGTGMLGACDGGSGCGSSVYQLRVPSAPVGNTTVGIVGGGTGNIASGQIHAMVSRAIDLAGGLTTIYPGQTVVIKPNLTYGDASICTHVEVIRGIVLEVKKRTSASNITVAERAALDYSTLEVAQAIGLLDVIEEEGVNFVAWEDTPYIEATCDAWTHIAGNLQIPESLTDGTYDHFINAPILKNHEMVTGANVDFTCCLKCHVGVLHPDSRLGGGSWQGGGIHTSDLGEKVAELNLVAPSHALDVVDALNIVLTQGPGTGGATANAGLVLASKDRVACDSVAVAALRYHAKLQNISKPYVNKSVWQQASIVRARALNLGRGPNNITVSDENVPDISGIMSNWS